MKSRAEQLEKIDRYLEGNLQGEALEEFKARMNQDPAFVMLVEAQKKANDLVIGNRLFKVREMMKADFENGKIKGSGSRMKWITGALLIALVSGAVLFMDKDNRKKDTGRISPVAAADHNEISAKETETDQTGKVPETASMPAVSAIAPKPDAFRPVQEKQPEVKTQSLVIPAPADPLSDIKLPDPVPHQDESRKADIAGVVHKPAKAGCPEISPEMEIRTERTCKDNKQGGVFITLKGQDRKRELMYLLNRAGSKDTLESQSGNFNLLSEGEYNLFFRDKNGCMSEYKETVLIEGKMCPTSRSFSFSPAYNEQLTIPVPDGQEGNILILDKAGREVFAAEFHGNRDIRWDGLDKSARRAEPGAYLYIIEYSDGTKERGQIAVY